MIFKQLSGDTVVTIKMGVFREYPVYVSTSGNLFTKMPSGFIRLFTSGRTSCRGYMVAQYNIEGRIFIGYLNRLTINSTEADGSKNERYNFPMSPV